MRCMGLYGKLISRKVDLAQARPEAELFLKLTMSTEERTWRALALEANARVAVEEGDLSRGQHWVTQALQAMEGFEVPLAAGGVLGTASAIHELMREPGPADKHRELSRAIIMKLANSMPVEEPLRKKFLLAPAVVSFSMRNHFSSGPTRTDPRCDCKRLRFTPIHLSTERTPRLHHSVLPLS